MTRKFSLSVLCLSLGLGQFAMPAQAQSSTPTPECTLADGQNDSHLTALVNAGQCSLIGTAANATVSFNQSVTVPSGMKVHMASGAKWDVADGVEVTLQGGYDIPMDRTAFFEGLGTVSAPSSYAGGAVCDFNATTAYPEWFGAAVNDDTDDSVAINKALGLSDTVELAPGTYHVQERIPLLGNETLSGAGKAATTLEQLPYVAEINRILVTTEVEDNAWHNYHYRDFIVGVSSDCAQVSDMKIDGKANTTLPQIILTELPDGVYDTDDPDVGRVAHLMSGIQISSQLQWHKFNQNDPNGYIKDTKILRVDIDRPVSSCLNLQSNRGAHKVLIDDVTCTARDDLSNTSGFTIEADHQTHANRYHDVTVQNSTFEGGSWGLYIAGVTDFKLIDSHIIAKDNAFNAALFYTSDNNHPITAHIEGTTFTMMTPTAGTSRGVVELAARNYARDTLDFFPYLRPTDTVCMEDRLGESPNDPNGPNCTNKLPTDQAQIVSRIEFVDSTFESAEFDANQASAPMVPLILDNIGFEETVKITNSDFNGGEHGIQAGNPYLVDAQTGDIRTAFEGTVFISMPNGAPTVIRDLRDVEIAYHRVHHSKFRLSLNRFKKQANSAVTMHLGSLWAFDNYFTDIGLNPANLDNPILDLGGKYTHGGWDTLYHYLANNNYSGVNATTFVRIPKVVYDTFFRWGPLNQPYQSELSRPASQMESIRIY